MNKGIYPNTFYRVSLKAIIRNENGDILCVKEGNGTDWSLPGGGIDHGETEIQAITRELQEEIAFKGEFTAQPIGMEQMWLESRQAYLIWLVYEVVPKDGYSFGVGEDASEVAFIDPLLLKDSSHRAERLVYKWCVDRTYDPFSISTL